MAHRTRGPWLDLFWMEEIQLANPMPGSVQVEGADVCLGNVSINSFALGLAANDAQD